MDNNGKILGIAPIENPTVIGMMSEDLNVAKKRILVHTAALEHTNATPTANFFDQTLNVLGPNFERNKVLLFITDAAPYMKKAGDAINIFYPKITHITCVAHTLHNVCEEIRSHFSIVNVLISSVKKTFVKCPSRVAVFKTRLPDVELPPEPITTGWGAWLSAVNFYAKHF